MIQFRTIKKLNKKVLQFCWRTPINQNARNANGHNTLKMALFKKFCCCIGLQTGVTVIGWLGLAFCLLAFLLALSIFELAPNETGKIWTLNLISLTVFLHVVLLYAVFKSVKLMLIPWLILIALEILLLAVHLATRFIGLFLYDEYHGIRILNSYYTSETVFVIFMMVFDGMYVYFWLCVVSLYQMIKEDEVSKSQCQNADTELKGLSSTPQPDCGEFEKIILP
ncbi:uncharacterized protein LOC143914812 isoform X2 [Arctopsyche grandis]|uniref:uncharacterized protein LOC143914812 isoform X2 n=1 Tax=Arctopsyche grandis TaxID=121162 RepID=UPI00406D6497